MYIETHRQRLSRLRGGVGGDAETHKVRRYPRHERKQQRPRESRDTERGPKWTRERRGSCTHRQLSVSGRDQEHRDTGTHTFAQSKVKLPGTQDRLSLGGGEVGRWKTEAALPLRDLTTEKPVSLRLSDVRRRADRRTLRASFP